MKLAGLFAASILTFLFFDNFSFAAICLLPQAPKCCAAPMTDKCLSNVPKGGDCSPNIKIDCTPPNNGTNTSPPSTTNPSTTAANSATPNGLPATMLSPLQSPTQIQNQSTNTAATPQQNQGQSPGQSQGQGQNQNQGQQPTGITRNAKTTALNNQLNNKQSPSTPSAPPGPPEYKLERTGDTYDHNEFKKHNDQCATSSGISSNYSCDSTYNTVQFAHTSNMLAQTAGSMTTAALGQRNAMNAYQSGTQKAALEAAASTQETAGQMNLGMGAVNAALGAYQIYKAQQHKSYGKEIMAAGSAGGKAEGTQTGTNTNAQLQGKGDSGWVTANGSVGNKIIEGYQLNQKSTVQFHTVTSNNANERQMQLEHREKDIKTHENEVKNRMRGIASDAEYEQKHVASQATVSGMMSIITGAQQAMSGGFNIMAARSLRSTINQLGNNNTGGTIQGVTIPGPNGNIAGAQAFTAPNAITGSGQDPAQSNDAVDAQPTDTPTDLGEGFNPNPMKSNLPEGPAAAKFNAGTPQGQSGGGGGGLGGGGSTNPADPAPDEPQARLAAQSQGTAYDSGGGGAFMGGGGGGKGAEGGPDLSSLLEKFLPPKKGEEDKPSTSIMDFGGKEGPSGQPPFSVLGRDTNIFQRITDTYRDKQSRGSVGI